MRPLVVVEGTGEAYRAAVRRLAADGWTVVEGLGGQPPRTYERIVRAGPVTTAAEGAAAVLAALRGAGVVVHAQAGRDVVDRLCDDLRRLGRVEHHPDNGPPDAPHRLTSEQAALLDLLAEGLAVGEAAARLHLSRRTANRRLAEARQVLGARTTTEAVVATRR